MEFRVLGSLEVLDDAGHPVDVRGTKPRRLLAALLLRVGQPVSVDTLADVLWSDEAPAGAANALQAHVSKLRKVLPGMALHTQDSGYVLAVDPATIDAHRFDDAAARGAALLAGGRAEQAASTLRDALELWRGPALADFAFDDFAEAERARLDELRLTVTEACIDAEMAAGRHDAVVSELEGLVAQHPMRERLWELLMLALYRAGRQSDALRAFQRAREILADELGLEPGPALRALEERILGHDVAIAPPPPSRPAGRLSNIHPELTTFLGRDDELHLIDAFLADRRLVTILGPGGVGKTRLAVEVALRADGRWRDGAWLVELGIEAGSGGAGRAFLRTFGPRLGQTDADANTDWLTTGLADTELLVVVDNCEHLVIEAAGIVAALLRSCPSVRVLATSREPLGIPGEVVSPLSPLALDDAVALFATRAADSSGSFVLDGDAAAAVATICDQVDRLPLAIELTAARTRAFSARQLAELLRDRFRLVTADSSSRPARQQTLHATVQWSFDLLFEAERRLLCRLAVFAGGFTLDAATAVCSDELLPASDVELLLARLVDKSLVTPIATGTPTGRFRLLRPVADFCAARLEDAGETAVMRTQHVRWLVALTSEITAGLRGPATADWAHVARAELSNVNGAAQWCRTDGDPTDALRLGVNLGWYSFLSADAQTDELILVDLIDRAVAAPAPLRARAVMWAALLSVGRTGRRTWAMDAVDVAHTAAGTTAREKLRLDGAAMSLEAIASARAIGDDALLLETLTIGSLHLAATGWHPDVLRTLNDEARDLARGDGWATAFVTALDGMAAYVAGELAASMALLRSAISALRAAGDESTAALFEVSFSEVAELTGDMAGATAAMAVATQVGAAGGWRSATVLKAVLCWLAGRNGEIDRALALGREVVALAHQPFNPVIRAQALFALGVAEVLADDHDAAGDHLREALAIHDQVGMVREAAMDHRHLGDLYRIQGDHQRAIAHGRRAVEMAVVVGLPWTVMLTARTLARSLVSVGRTGEACQLIAIAGGVADTFGYTPTADEQQLIDEVMAAGEQALGTEHVARLVEAAAVRSFERVTDVLDADGP